MIESEELCLTVADRLAVLAEKLGLTIIFKSSFDKANRTSITSFRGPGLDNGLAILDRVRQKSGLPIISDIHLPDQAVAAGEVLDVIQIPAFLCRQTDLLVAAGRTGRPINLKKAQFMAPEDMTTAAAKVNSTGRGGVLLTERGSSFGYRNLVVDMRSIVTMGQTGWPVVFDATHSVQQPGGLGDRSGGSPRFIEPLAMAATAAGADGVFMEVHPDPDSALCDGPNSLPLDRLESVLRRLIGVAEARDAA